MKRLDPGHLHPKLEVPSLGRETNPGLHVGRQAALYRKEPSDGTVTNKRAFAQPRKMLATIASLVQSTVVMLF